MSAEKSNAWRDLKVRTLSGIMLGAVGAFCIWAGDWPYKIMVAAMTAGMAAEAATLFKVSPRSWRGGLYVLWAACAWIAAVTGHWNAFPLFCLSSLIFGLPLCAIMCVIVVACNALLWLRLGGALPVLFVIGVVVASDSCAYLTGRMLGGPKLAPRISPGKTWSGSAGGLLAALLTGFLVASASDYPATGSALFCAGVLAVVGQIGDLAESGVKRKIGVKDSGSILPGHGGLLDRFDGLIFAAPAAALFSLCVTLPRPFWTADLHAVLTALTTILHM